MWACVCVCAEPVSQDRLAHVSLLTFHSLPFQGNVKGRQKGNKLEHRNKQDGFHVNSRGWRNVPSFNLLSGTVICGKLFKLSSPFSTVFPFFLYSVTHFVADLFFLPVLNPSSQTRSDTDLQKTNTDLDYDSNRVKVYSSNLKSLLSHT